MTKPDLRAAVETSLEAPAVRLPARLRMRSLFWRHIWRVSSLLFVLAWIWRRLLPRTRFVAVTGALGKTTCKELTADVLAVRHATFRTPGNLNARAGVALSVLRVRPRHAYAVLEVGVGGPGDMDRVARMVRPDVAVVLCVKGTHTRAFSGGLAQHAAEKAKLVAAVRPGGVVVLNVDDPLVRAMKARQGVRTVWTGSGAGADVRTAPVAARWPDRLALHVTADGSEREVPTRLVGLHWTPAVAAAIAVGREAGVGLAEAAGALARTEPFPGRLQPTQLPSGAVVLRDDYNASADSAGPAFEVLGDARAGRRVLVVTDISDTGSNRKNRLRTLGAAAAGCADLFVLVGESAAYGARQAVRAGMPAAAALGFSTLQEAAAFLRRELRAGDLALVKGRTTDHAGRLFWAQFGPLSCWRSHCPKRQVCDTCAELGAAAPAGRRAGR